jgi:Sec-independent protein translocase protein TatA
MITTVIFLFFLGLVVLGPKKTMAIAQDLGRSVTHLKHALSVET